MQSFKVAAKCGHVGKGQYYKGLFYVQSESAEAAAKIVRMEPRVKHDHKDAILYVTKIEEPEFKAGKASFYKNPYFRCKNIQEQKLFWDEISKNVYPETNPRENKKLYNVDRQVKLHAQIRYYRKMDKYGRNHI